MSTYRVLVAEKDLLARQAMSRVLRKEKNFEIAAISWGGESIDKIITTYNPHVVLLNLENLNTPDFEVFTKLRVRFPDLPVVVISPRNEDGARAAVTAISMGAVDVVTKPNRCNNLLFANRHLTKRLIPIVNTAATLGYKSGSSPYSKGHGNSFQMETNPEREAAIADEENRETGLIVIGGCLGGPKSLFSLLSKLPGDLPVPVIVVQHFPKIFTRILADELNKRSKLSVREVKEGAELKAGTVWIAPGGYHTEVHRDGCKTLLRTHRGPREMGDRPSINILFRSAAKYYGSHAVGIILSGIGRDGLAGAEAIHSAGGRILVQSPDSSVASELPYAIIRKGIMHKICNMEELVEESLSRLPDKGSSFEINQPESTPQIGNRSITSYRNTERMDFSSLI